MPREISGANVPGKASYTLGASELFSVEAITCLMDVPVAAADNFVALDYRSGSNEIIYRQFLNYEDTGTTFFSLSAGAEPWAAEAGSNTVWPQQQQAGDLLLTQRLSRLTLGSGCQVVIYCTKGSSWPLGDPLSDLETRVTFFNLHLWVTDDEDATGGEPPPLEPVYLIANAD